MFATLQERWRRLRNKTTGPVADSKKKPPSKKRGRKDSAGRRVSRGSRTRQRNTRRKGGAKKKTPVAQTAALFASASESVKQRIPGTAKRNSRSRKRRAASKASQKNRKKNKNSTASGPPETWWRRWIWYTNPKRFMDWWFTKPGMFAALKIAGTVTGVVVIFIIGLFFYFARDLPNPGEINALDSEQTTKFYDRTGETVLYEVFGDKNRTFVELDQMSDHVKNATVAMENQNFYQQGTGISTIGILRAAVYNVLNINDGSLQGGSTITQQYVKNALLTPERTISRKIKEIILSIQIEQLYSKDEILELYMNEIPYGAQAYGVQAASQMYFSKDADQLDLDEAAMLAALPQAPSFYSPYGDNTKALNTRIDTILELMADQGYISEEKSQKAIESDTLAKVNNTPDAYRDIKAPHFVLNVQQQLEEKYGTQKVMQGGLEVITTINLDMQKKAQKAVKNNIQNVVNGGGDNAALVASNPNNGQVIAMVGSRGFEYKQFGAYNAATARRQPGSSFKPYVYAKAFEDTENWGAGSIMYDVRTDFGGGYVPSNFDDSFRGALPVRSALAESRNIPAIKMLYIVGMEPTLKQVRQMGITTLSDPSNYGLSLVLGAGEVRLDQHVNAYETFANGGMHHKQTKILKVTDPDGTVLQEWKKKKPERIFDKQTTYLISDILSDDNARAPTFGYNNPNLAVPGHTVAIKTGTTDDLRDGWMMGYSKDLTAGVWTGHHQNEPMHVATSNTTGPIFTQFMNSALKGKSNKPFQRPEGVKSVQLDAYTGDKAVDKSKKTVTDLFPKWYQPSESDALETATINKLNNKLATECTPERAKKEISSYGLEAEIPPDDPAFSRWNPPVQALADRLDISGGGSIPEEKDDCEGETGPEITKMEADNEDGDDTIEITVKVKEGTHDIKEGEVRYEGSPIEPLNSAGTKTFEHPVEGDREHTFKAVVVDTSLRDDTAQDSAPGPDDEGGGGDTTDNGLPFGEGVSNIQGAFLSPYLWHYTQ